MAWQLLNRDMLVNPYDIPAQSCDCHIHSFGPRSTYPIDQDLSYEPPETSIDSFREHVRSFGIQRAVVVQPTPYGTDNSCTIDAVRRMEGHARAIVVVDAAVSEAELHSLHEKGARGVRFNLVQKSNRPSLQALEHVAARVSSFGWHIQLYLASSHLVEIEDRLRQLPCAIVIDHFGQLDTKSIDEQSILQSIQRLMDRNAWIKVSAPYRIDFNGPPFGHAVKLTRTLTRHAAERCVWGSDWPHVALPAGGNGDTPSPAYRDLLATLAHGCDSEEIFRKVLSENPAKLYGF